MGINRGLAVEIITENYERERERGREREIKRDRERERERGVKSAQSKPNPSNNAFPKLCHASV